MSKDPHLTRKQIRFLWAIGYFRYENSKDGFRIDRRNARRYFDKLKKKRKKRSS